MAGTEKRGLGRGLGALLGSEDATMPVSVPGIDPSKDVVERIKIGLIDPNRDQPRRHFREDALMALADSIKNVGVIQPIIVRKVGTRYQIIAGERRWRASRMAGCLEIPAIVRDFDEVKRLEVALIENLQRDDLNPVEQACGVKGLMESCGYTQEAAAQRLGMSRPAVTNLLRLLMLPQMVQGLLIDGLLSAGHARALLSLQEEQAQIKLANHAVNQGLSVRQLEKLVRELPLQAQAQQKIVRRDPAQQELERMARDVFGTRAQIDGSADKGKLILHYYSAEDLQRIWDVLDQLNQGSV